MIDTNLESLLGYNYKILKLFLDDPKRELNLAEAEKKLEISKMTIYRALERMVELGILTSYSDNYRRFYKLTDSPIILPLRLLRNVDSPLISELMKKIRSRSSLILLYGSRANGTDRKDSDWDILILSDEINIVELNSIISKLESKYNCQINIKLYTSIEFSKIKSERTPFYLEVMANKLILKGELNET